MSGKLKFYLKDGSNTINMCNEPKEIGNVFRGLRNHGIIPQLGAYIAFNHSEAYRVSNVIHTVDYDDKGEFISTDILVEKANIAHLA